jgi:hypothetical protein
LVSIFWIYDIFIRIRISFSMKIKWCWNDGCLSTVHSYEDEMIRIVCKYSNLAYMDTNIYIYRL